MNSPPGTVIIYARDAHPNARRLGALLAEREKAQWGIVTGSAAALIAMLPHLLSTGADIPWIELAVTLGAVLIIGTLAAVFPICTSLRFPIREVLTSET